MEKTYLMFKIQDDCLDLKRMHPWDFHKHYVISPMSENISVEGWEIAGGSVEATTIFFTG